MIHLDTGFLIHALVKDSSADKQLRKWLVEGVPLAVSTIVWAEFLCGPVKSHEIELAARIIPEQVPFVADDAELSARLFNLGRRRRGSLADCMIAATTLRCGASLATANPTDFHKLESSDLKIISET
ncbi:MAG: type II toxin-antitoxin system VapC family toxin [Gammaproteobacteria bacterium]